MQSEIKIVQAKKEVAESRPPDGKNLKSVNMYAIVEIAGQQFKVEKDKKIFVHRLDAAEGDSVDFDKVLLVDNDGRVDVGTPV